MKLLFALLLTLNTWAAIPDDKSKSVTTSDSLKERLRKLGQSETSLKTHTLVFDIPVTYNQQVAKWVHYFQNKGSKWFREYLERSSKYLPFIQDELGKANLPLDLAFMVMVESGFSTSAVSSASAVGPWQFIEGTAARYGLRKHWWLDERRDFRKSTKAAIKYIKDLHQEFGSWYLVAASYNMGENGLRRQIAKYKTNDYWTLVHKKALPEETQNYVPKILAAMLITKSPNLYGFRLLERRDRLDYDYVSVPGGTDLESLADALGVTRKSLKELNSELLVNYVPKQIASHTIRVPLGAGKIISEFLSKRN